MISVCDSDISVCGIYTSMISRHRGSPGSRCAAAVVHQSCTNYLVRMRPFACGRLRAAVCVRPFACGRLRAAVCVRPFACGRLRAAVCVRPFACGRLHAAVCVWPFACSRLRAAVCVRPFACGRLRAAVCVRPCGSLSAYSRYMSISHVRCVWHISVY